MIAFSFSSSGKIPLYEQLYRHLKEQIEYGGLKPESKLISCRKLADYLEVSLSTVLNAHAQLKAEGYIDSKPKRGYYVCQIDSGILGKRKTFREVKTSAQEDGFLFDLSTNGVDVNLFPFMGEAFQASFKHTERRFAETRAPSGRPAAARANRNLPEQLQGHGSEPFPGNYRGRN